MSNLNLNETVIFAEGENIENKDVFIKILKELNFELSLEEKLINGVMFYYINILNINDLLSLIYIRKLRKLLKMKDFSNFRYYIFSIWVLISTSITWYLYSQDDFNNTNIYTFFSLFILAGVFLIPMIEIGTRMQFKNLKSLLINNFLGEKGKEYITNLELK